MKKNVLTEEQMQMRKGNLRNWAGSLTAATVGAAGPVLGDMRCGGRRADEMRRECCHRCLEILHLPSLAARAALAEAEVLRAARARTFAAPTVLQVVVQEPALLPRTCLPPKRSNCEGQTFGGIRGLRAVQP